MSFKVRLRLKLCDIYYVTDSAAAVGPPVGLAQARPNYYVTNSAAAVGGLAQARPNYYYTENAAAVRPPVGLAQARPNNTPPH